MRKIFAFSLMAALVLASCSPKEDFAPTPAAIDKAATVRASIENATRTTLVEDTEVYHVLWKAGDIIRCTDNKNTKVLYKTTDDGVQEAVFTWMAENGVDTTGAPYALHPDSTKFWAFYPSTISGRLPAIQQYVENGLAVVPMRGFYERAADAPFEPVFTFKNLCGAIKLGLTTTAADVKVVKIVLRADNGLSGSFDVTNAEPQAAVTNTTGTATLDCPEVPLGTTPTSFFISVPQYVYHAFSVTVIASDGRTQTRSLKGGEVLEIERAKIYDLDLAFDDLAKPAVGATATFAAGSEVNTAIKSLVNPDVSGHQTDDSTVTRMVFVTGSDAFSAVNVAAPESESPIYVFYDEATTTITVSTPAPKFVLNRTSSFFFHRFLALQDIEGIDDFDTSNVEAMSYFMAYSPKTSITMPASWDYSSLVNTRYMFYGTQAQTIDVSNMDFSQDTSMYYMFGYSENLDQVIWPSEVDASRLESMGSIYRGTAMSIIDMTMFKNTDGLMNMRYAFSYCPNLTKVISDMILDAVPKSLGGNSGAGYCFAYSCENSGVLDLTEFDVSALHTLAYAFYGNKASTLKLDTWELNSGIESMSYMFYQCPNLSSLYLGPDFISTLTPEGYFFGKSLTEGKQTGSNGGMINIYCTEETAQWLVKTNLRLANPTEGNSTYVCKVDAQFHILDPSTGNYYDKTAASLNGSKNVFWPSTSAGAGYWDFDWR